MTCVDKSNVTRGCQLFRKIFREFAESNQDVPVKEAYIDAFTMWLVRNPEDLDIVVLPNMFGDIATDLASVLQGGMGMSASANMGPRHMLFEPVHGSAPKHAGKNIVNPIAMIQSVQMMFENEVAILDDGDEDRLAKRLFQYEVLSNTWGVAGCFDVTVKVGQETITSKYCHWQEAVEYFQMLHAKTAHLLDRYSEASVVLYLVKTEEEMRYHVWRLLISFVNVCSSGLFCCWASKAHFRGPG